MEKNNKDIKYINGVEVARLEDYGFKDHKVLKKAWKIFSDILCVFVILMIYLSIFIIAIQSVNTSSDLCEFENFTLKWYTQIFSHPMLSTVIKNTLIISICATLASTILGTLIAIGIHYLEGKRRQQIMLLNNIPLLNADIVTGISIMLLFSFVMKLPGCEYIFGFPTMLVAHVYFSLPYVVLNVLPKLREIDPNLMDAALDLGLKPKKALIRVLIPALKSGILAGMIFAFTMSFDDFVVSYYTTGNGFNNLSIWIYSSIGRKSLTPSVYAFSTLVTFGSMAILLIINWLSNRKNKKNK